ncbi:MAG: helix-turn-helix domain-containing protein [Acidimicrobiia bacterium]|nr:helix-turn-helix domain-containing protein [Acidimicrobiia bacterium]
MSDSKPHATPADEPPQQQGRDALGDFIRRQRRLAELSQRELARLADLSDAYLSQLERGLHEPSVRVVNALAGALKVPPDKLLKFLRMRDPSIVDGDGASDAASTESAILTDDRLSDAQKQSLRDVYRAFLAANDHV